MPQYSIRLEAVRCLAVHNLFTSCIRRCIVSRALVTCLRLSERYLQSYLFSVSNSGLLFFSCRSARTRNIGHRTLPKIWVGTFLVRGRAQGNNFEFILTVKMETRQRAILVVSFGRSVIISELWRPSFSLFFVSVPCARL